MTTVRQAANEQSATRELMALRHELDGRLILPADPEYDAARMVFMGDIDRRPAAIVRVASSHDISLVIGLASATGLELAVRSGGHSAVGFGTTNDGVVIDLRDLKATEFATDDASVWADTGLTAAELTGAAWARSGAIGFGDTGSVGIGGITLGGGVGYLVRKHGLTIDSLLAAEIVTADGELVTADEESHPDLFWAIRGGGGNYGVATRFHFRLQPTSGFVGGTVLLPATADTVAGFIEAADEAPDELSTIANVMNCPPMPFLPPEVVNQTVILGFLAYLGDATAGESAMAPFRTLAKPLFDDLKARPYPEMYAPEDESYRPKVFDRTMFVDHFDRDTAATIVDRLEASDAPLRAVQLRVLGGAMARVADDATAFAHRGRRIMAQVVNFYGGPDDLPTRKEWVNSLAAEIDDGTPGAYVNFLRDDGADRIHEAYPDAVWKRLREVKRRYDPANIFRLNQNIAPASS